MIKGIVSAELDATIKVVLLGSNGHEQEVEGVVDTGFNGFLTLPSSVLGFLGFPRIGRGRAILADGHVEVFDVHAATVIWDGQRRDVFVDASEESPLVGMSLLEGYKLEVAVSNRGKVTIRRLTPIRKRKRAKHR